MTTATETYLTRDEAIKRIRKALKARSGKQWSVTGGRGTAWGWLTIDAPPARRKFDYRQTNARDYLNRPEYEAYEVAEGEFGYTGPEDRAELAKLLDIGDVHYQGVSIPSGSDYYQEYVDRAEGREPTARGERYWD